MCGIAGFLDPVLQIVDRTAVLGRMCDALIHRGPDDAGQIVDGPVGLGMRRLSIVDIAGGAQPMTSPDGAVTLVYNGEIYNHHEVRTQLEAVGRAFRTRSDTEVLLAQYERHGLEGLNALNGMFAAAIWDRRSRRLHLMRDRMGVKPLYYFVDDRRLYFGSELKSLVAAASFTPEVNPRAVWDYLSFRYVPAPHTIWRNVRKLPPAHVLTVAEGEMAAVPRRWWDMPYALQGAEGSADVPADESEFAPLFEDAVNIRMVADVPVGVFLSGGLDSSAVVAAVDRERFPDLETFAISLDAGGEDDELGYARMVSQALGTRHHELSLSGTDFSAMLEDMPWHTDEPLADATCVPVLALARAARREVKVVLSGEGSDEILAGYTFDAVQAAWDAMAATAIPPKTRRLASLIDQLGFRRPGGRGRDERAAWARHPGDQRDAAAPLHIVDYYVHEEKARLFRSAHSFPDSREILRQDLARVRDDEPLHQALYLYSQNWLVEDLLMKADKMTMAASLELRTPFLDKRLVELAARLPRRAKLRRRADGSYETKAILRDYARAHLPREIIDRPKRGFPVPVYRWLSGPLKELVMDRLGAGSARCHAWLEPDAVRALAKAGTAADADVFSRHRLWNLLILELWLLRWTP